MIRQATQSECEFYPFHCIRPAYLVHLRRKSHPIQGIQGAGRWLVHLLGPIPDFHIILMHGSKLVAEDLNLPDLPEDELKLLDE